MAGILELRGAFAMMLLKSESAGGGAEASEGPPLLFRFLVYGRRIAARAQDA